MIKLENVSKSFNNKDILINFNYTFENKKYLIIGPSGCGKTTLINLIMGILKPDKGNIYSDCTFSCAFQQPRLLEKYSVQKNIELFTKQKNLSCSLLQKEILKQKVETLSGGQKQKLSIYIACKAISNCIILDEPFNNLDELSIQEIINFIDENSTNKTLIICSHQTKYLNNYQIINLNKTYLQK